MALQLDRLGKNVIPPYLGRVAIGEKDERGYPKKLDYFIFTHLVDPKTKRAMRDKEATAAMSEKHGEKPNRIRIVLPFDHPDEVLYNSLTNYPGASGWDCKSEDGITAVRKEKSGEQYECACDFTTCKWKVGKDGKDTCKATGILSFMLLDVPRTGGLWRFTTRGYTSVFSIKQSLEFMYNLRGSLKGLEVELIVTMTPMTVPDGKGGMSKQNVPIVSVQLPYNARALANGEGTVYGDFKTIMEAAHKRGTLPDSRIMKTIGMTVDEEVTLISDPDSEAGTIEGERTTSSRERESSRREETRPRDDDRETRSNRRSREADDDDNPF